MHKRESASSFSRTVPRGRFQFSIKWMLVFTFLAACLATYYLYSTRPLILQNEALATLRKRVKEKTPQYYPLKDHPPITTRWEYYPWFGKEKRAEVLTKADFHAQVYMGQDWDTYEIVLQDKDMPTIGQFTELKYLELNGSVVTDDGLKHLRGLLKLEHLDLSNTKVNGSGFQHIAGLPNLKTLILDKLTISGGAIQALSKCKSLEQVSGCSVIEMDDQQWASFASNPSLTKLQFDVLHADHLRVVDLPKLTEFKVQAGAFRNFESRNCPRLFEIEIGEGSFSGTEVFYVEHLPMLSSLKNKNAAGDVRVHDCPELKVIELQSLGNEVDAFLKLPKLERLYVSGGVVTERVASEIFQCTKLLDLLLSIGGDDGVLTGLSNLTSLEEFWITETGLSENVVQELSKLPKLRTLGLFGVSRPDLDFGSVVKECESVTRVRLNDCAFEDVRILSHSILRHFSSRDLRTDSLEFADLPSLTWTRHSSLNVKSIAAQKMPLASRLEFELAPDTSVERIEIGSLPKLRALDIYAEGASSRRKPPGATPKVPAKVFLPDSSFPMLKVLSNAPSNRAIGPAGVRGGIRLQGCDVVLEAQ